MSWAFHQLAPYSPLGVLVTRNSRPVPAVFIEVPRHNGGHRIAKRDESPLHNRSI